MKNYGSPTRNFFMILHLLFFVLRCNIRQALNLFLNIVRIIFKIISANFSLASGASRVTPPPCKSTTIKDGRGFTQILIVYYVLRLSSDSKIYGEGSPSVLFLSFFFFLNEKEFKKGRTEMIGIDDTYR